MGRDLNFRRAAGFFDARRRRPRTRAATDHPFTSLSGPSDSSYLPGLATRRLGRPLSLPGLGPPGTFGKHRRPQGGAFLTRKNVHALRAHTHQVSPPPPRPHAHSPQRWRPPSPRCCSGAGGPRPRAGSRPPLPALRAGGPLPPPPAPPRRRSRRGPRPSTTRSSSTWARTRRRATGSSLPTTSPPSRSVRAIDRSIDRPIRAGGLHACMGRAPASLNLTGWSERVQCTPNESINRATNTTTTRRAATSF